MRSPCAEINVSATFNMWLMVCMAIAEVILHVLTLYEGGQAIHLVQGENVEDVLYILHATQVTTSLSLLSVVVISLYYGVARRYLRLQDGDMKPYRPSYCFLLLKLLVIAFGALGIVAVTFTAASTGTIKMVLSAESIKGDDEQLKSVESTMYYAYACVVLKLLEALLGHWWALLKSRDDDVTR